MRLPGVVSLLLHAAFLAVFALGARFEPSLGGGFPGDFTPVSLIDASQLPGPPPRAVARPRPAPVETKEEEPEEPEPVPEPPKPEPPKPAPEKEDPGVNVSDKAPKVESKAPPDTLAAEPAPKPRPAARGSQAAAEEALAGVEETKAGRDGGLVAAGIEGGMDGSGGGGGGGGGFGDFGYYRVAIQNRIGANWSPAFVSGEAITIVYFRIIRSGAIVGARVEESSGIQFYDQTALRAVLSSSPLPPLPAQFPEDAVGVHFRFRYKQ